MARRSTLYACPRNGESTMCEVDRVPFPHRREELVPDGRRVPSCETHRIRLVRADEIGSRAA